MGGFSIPANGGAVMIRVYLVEGELGGGWGWWMLGGGGVAVKISYNGGKKTLSVHQKKQ